MAPLISSRDQCHLPCNVYFVTISVSVVFAAVGDDYDCDAEQVSAGCSRVD